MKVLIIDDHEMIKEGVEKRVRNTFEKAVCLFATNSRLALQKVQENDIDLMICDLEFRNEVEKDGFFIIQSIKSLAPDVKSIALTTYESYTVMQRALQSGFNSFLSKGCSQIEFSETLKNVIKYGNHESPTMTKLRDKRNGIAKGVFKESLAGLNKLTFRELNILCQLHKTTDSALLGEESHIAPATVDTHIKNIRKKLSLKSRKDLVLFYKEFENEILKLLPKA